MIKKNKNKNNKRAFNISTTCLSHTVLELSFSALDGFICAKQLTAAAEPACAVHVSLFHQRTI
jgi:hypothetical protein